MKNEITPVRSTVVTVSSTRQILQFLIICGMLGFLAGCVTTTRRASMPLLEDTSKDSAAMTPSTSVAPTLMVANAVRSTSSTAHPASVDPS